ncbi:substrate-binding domain-containing protein [Pimelobacter simplex]|uniref:LacI family transcriptional regulator n=1 Tax=Nocardioides simplex TaxID=2045 RepID=A0A0A1DWH3_NOCSI|nr:LacI family DNA-binding transcriptional regulator [Pimelobacter simplex]AIY19800.2 LacI family transcriptional regulator [Pimelobacter simplex]MCG8151892.1 substrate-binding domain-containing protein [Pimelobacter simplex]GEB12651.1 LacI family transcriptional regulator [Pimelobacter simplex]SFM56344.1 transcriptional regulator, LacI family [Pimelobacter simplex]
MTAVGQGKGGRAGARRATLATVADLAGYHVSTVSRVLNGTTVPGARSASSAAAERIRQVAREVGYVPNAQAAALRRQRTGMVGVIMARMTDTVAATIYEGVERAAAEHGYQTLVMNSWDDDETRARCVDLLMAHGVDALIHGDALADGSSLQVLERSGLPFVLVNRGAGAYPSVTADDRGGGRQAAEHLLALGHREVGVLAGLPYAGNAIERTRGFCETFAEAGHPVRPDRVVPTTFDSAGGRTGADRLLRAGDGPTALFAVSDAAAIGALGSLRDQGLHPGRDVSVVGFNDMPIAGDLTVPLTTVRSPMREIGERSVALLLAVMEGEPGEVVRFPTELVVRETTGPAPGLTRGR